MSIGLYDTKVIWVSRLQVGDGLIIHNEWDEEVILLVKDITPSATEYEIKAEGMMGEQVALSCPPYSLVEIEI